MSANEGFSSTRIVHFSDTVASEEIREVELAKDDANTADSTESPEGVSNLLGNLWGKMFVKSNHDAIKIDDDGEKSDDEDLPQSRYIFCSYLLILLLIIHQRKERISNCQRFWQLSNARKG